MEKFFLDTDGKPSSKRLAGFVLVSLAIIASILLWIKSVFFLAASDATTALYVTNSFFWAGGGLLGVGVFEKIGKNDRK
jgi:hypothetical protein